MFRLFMLFVMIIVVISGCREDSSTSTSDNTIDTTKNYVKINRLIKSVSTIKTTTSGEFKSVSFTPFPNNKGGGLSVKGSVQSLDDADHVLWAVLNDYEVFELDNVEIDWQLEVGDQGVVPMNVIRETIIERDKSLPPGIYFY